MFPALLLGIAVVVGAFFLLRWYVAADPKSLVRGLKWIGLGVVVGLVVVLAATGRLSWAIGAATMLAPFLYRFLQARRTAKNWARMAGIGGGGRTSTVNTRFVRMNLDHDSGELDGEVREGRFAGRHLSELAVGELIDLLVDAAAEDAQSAQVLEAYLDRTHPGWRDDAGAAGAETGSGADSPAGGPMTPQEAYEILGLNPGASDDEVKAAHHRLISGLHPDRGGSNYLAAKVNQAKQVLLGR